MFSALSPCVRYLHAPQLLRHGSLGVRLMSGGPRPKKRPSRLVLSSKVAERKRPRPKGSVAPPSALNRRVANIPPSELERRNAPSRGRTADSKPKRDKPKRDFKHMKMSQALTTVPRSSRSVAAGYIESYSAMEDFHLLPIIKEAMLKDALSGLSTIEPTAVQKLAIPALLGQSNIRRKKGKNIVLESYLIAAETGSGKTLAYALPLLDYVKREEELEANKADAVQEAVAVKNRLPLEIPNVEKDDRTGKPRAVVLVPTSELVAQVGALFKSLSHLVKFRTALLSREVTRIVIRRLFASPVDVVVATPHLLNILTETSPDILSKCKFLVVDEADSLFDRSFSPVTSSVISKANNLQKLVLCSATIPRSLEKRLQDLYPDIQRLVTPNLHSIPRRVQLSVVDIDQSPYHGNRNLACADTLYNVAKEGTEVGFIKKVIVFVNERETATSVAAYLQSKGLHAVEFQRDSEGRSLATLLEQFTGSKEEAPEGLDWKQRMKVLVTTDIASRGVDTKTVKTVVLYDVPHTSIDFIHRVGRTGRLGRRGRAFVLVDKTTNKGWIKDIKTTMFMGGPLI